MKVFITILFVFSTTAFADLESDGETIFRYNRPFQIGYFKDPVNAKRLADKMGDKYEDSFCETYTNSKKGTLVSCTNPPGEAHGAFEKKSGAKEALRAFSMLEQKNCLIFPPTAKEKKKFYRVRCIYIDGYTPGAPATSKVDSSQISDLSTNRIENANVPDSKIESSKGTQKK